eukprot:Skav209090  [mRNA]  locus=scaffold207:843529:845505:+ [translate_table: standard]
MVRAWNQAGALCGYATVTLRRARNLGDPWKKRRLAQASKECPFGFYFLVAVQLTSAAHTQTFYMPPFSRVMDQVLQDISFFEAGARGHPLWRPGAVGIRSEGRLIGHWFYSGDRKYLRGFSDWNLRLDELNPLVSVAASGLPGEKGFLSAEWREEVMWKVRCSDWAGGSHL